MKKLELEICTGIGDNLVIRIFFDTIKHNYDQIRIAHSNFVIRRYWDNKPEYHKFCNDIGQALFTEPPYIYDKGHYPPIHTQGIMEKLNIVPVKPNLDNALCRGDSLNLKEKYIVITTKIRYIPKATFYPLSTQLWGVLNQLSKKYKIVILGERVLENSREVRENRNLMFSVYEHIIANIAPDRIIDLTIPAFGITVPNFKKIQQDCLIQKEAEFVIILGVGGNFCMAAAVANKVIGFRADNDGVADLFNNPLFTNLYVTKNWDNFINKLKEQI